MRESLQEKIYYSLRREIIDLTFKPGQSITEEELSSRFQVSRTPVREAFIRLQLEGLVTIVKHKGVFVRNVSLKDVVEIFQMRILLEGFAAAHCVEFIDIAQVRKILDTLAALKKEADGSEEKIETGISLHNLIRNSCGNSRVINSIKTLEGQILQSRSIAGKIPGRVDRSLQDHIQIAKAIVAGNKASAKTKMQTHLEGTLKDMLEFENLRLYRFS